MKISEFQRIIKKIFYDKDVKRGIDGTFRWMVEEIGELARSIKKMDKKKMEEEIADIFAWLCSIANLVGIDIEENTVKKYPGVCSKCGNCPCECEE